MNFRVGDFVTRKSHQHDIVFQIVEIEESVALLKGVEVRLCADSDVEDLTTVNDSDDLLHEDRKLTEKAKVDLNLDRSEYFYLPGKILHIDGDQDYLKRCIKFYTNLKVQAFGLKLKEDMIAIELDKYLKEYKPDILVITGHDAFYKNRRETDDKYQNSSNFIDAVKIARKYESSQDKLIIIAGACQSNYEELIKSGANFASSPKRINIHALDPAIIASSVALSEKNKSIDLIPIIEKTKYGIEGMGGIITNGTMYVGFPR